MNEVNASHIAGLNDFKFLFDITDRPSIHRHHITSADVFGFIIILGYSKYRCVWLQGKQRFNSDRVWLNKQERFQSNRAPFVNAQLGNKGVMIINDLNIS